MRFKILGIQVYVSFLFAAFITLLLIIDQTGLIIPVFMSSAIHELGHAIAMNRNNCGIIKISMKPGGCIITAPPFPDSKIEIIVALSGPLYNLTAAVLLAVMWQIIGYEGCFVAAVINAGLGLFNLLPFRGLDGGTVISVHLTKKHENGRELYYRFSLCAAIVFGVFCVAAVVNCGLNPSALLVAIYLISCALFKI